MTYFAKFPYIYYDFNDTKQFKLVKDILRRAIVRKTIKDTGSVFIEYQIKDMDRPEIIADKIYGSPNLHWVILLMNDIMNPYYDWPLNTRKLEKFVVSKYGLGNEANIHHYELSNGDVVNSPAEQFGEQTFVGTAITNRQHEDSVNEKKRTIKLLRPELIGVVVAEFEKKMNEK